jgi:hypothetical protein
MRLGRALIIVASLALVVGCGSSSGSFTAQAQQSDTGTTANDSLTTPDVTASDYAALPQASTTPDVVVDAAAQRVADFDRATDAAPYTAALDALSTCSDSRNDLASYAIFGAQDEAKYNLTESALAILHDIDTSRAGISDCKGVLAAYLTLREG